MRIWWNPVHVGSSTFTLVKFRSSQTHLVGSGLLQPLLYPVSGVATPPRLRSLASQQPMGQCSCFVLLSQQPMAQCSCLVLLLRHNQWNNAVELSLFYVITNTNGAVDSWVSLYWALELQASTSLTTFFRIQLPDDKNGQTHRLIDICKVRLDLLTSSGIRLPRTVHPEIWNIWEMEFRNISGSTEAICPKFWHIFKLLPLSAKRLKFTMA